MTDVQQTEDELVQVRTQFLKDKRGTATLEYGLLAGGIALVLYVAVQAFGLGLGETYHTVVSGLQSVNGSR